MTFSLPVSISNPKVETIDIVILYFSFIENRFVSTYSLSISNPGYMHIA